MIKVDQNKCVGCGLCVGMCPEIFALNLDGKSEVIAQVNEAAAKEAASACPVEAISVE
jgi:ferredoxin